MADRRGGVWLRWWQLAATVALTAAVASLVSPFAQAWAFGASLPQDTSATTYKSTLAGELAHAVFDDRFVNAHPAPIPIIMIERTPCGDRFGKGAIGRALFYLNAEKDDVAYRKNRSATVQALYWNLSKPQMSLLLYCVRDSVFSSRCSQYVASHIDTWRRPFLKETRAETLDIQDELNTLCRELQQAYASLPNRARGTQ